ncbi:MAG: ABC transporter ATP-binding protein [Chthoniobacteraceae bacterium]
MNKRPQIGMLVHREKEEENDVELKPLQFFKLLGRLFTYTKPYAPMRNALFAMVFIRSIQLPLIGKAIAWVINGAISHHNMGGLARDVFIFAALIIFTQFTFYFRVKFALEMSEAVIRDLRNAMFIHLQRMTFGFFNKMKVGRIISRMNSDLEAIRVGVQDVVFVSIVQLGQMVVSAIFMLLADRVLFFIMMAMAPIIWVLNRAFRNKLSMAQREAQESFSRITSTLAESVGGIRVTQGFVREEVNVGLFRDLLHDHSRYNMNLARTSAAFLPLLEFNSQFFIALLILIGGYRALNPAIATPVASIIQFIFLANLFFDPIKAIGNQYTQALTAMVGAERVFRLLDTKPEWKDAPDAVVLETVNGDVEFRDLSFGYDPGRIILRNINFTAKAGQTVALVGHTGSGKSSIINLISKFYLPVSGKLLIDGRDILSIDSDSLHRHLGMVQQQNFLFEGTVLDNIRFSRPGASDADVMAAAAKLDYLDLIEAMPNGFQTPVGEGGTGLSLGQRQLVCFTRALLADPRILILDEATSSIDAITELRIQNSLTTLLRGRTSFVVAHRLSTIRQADLILVMNQGEIVERGTHDELLEKDGVYKALYFQYIRSGFAEE